MCRESIANDVTGREPNHVYNEDQYSEYLAAYRRPSDRLNAVQITYSSDIDNEGTVYVKTWMSRTAINNLIGFEGKPSNIRGVVFTFGFSEENGFIICASSANPRLEYPENGGHFRYDQTAPITLRDVLALRNAFKKEHLKENLTPENKLFSFSRTQLLALLRQTDDSSSIINLPLELVLIPATPSGSSCPYFNLVVKRRNAEGKVSPLDDDGTEGCFYACPPECYD